MRSLLPRASYAVNFNRRAVVAVFFLELKNVNWREVECEFIDDDAFVFLREENTALPEF